MTFKQKISYFLIAFGLYLVIGLFTLFVLSDFSYLFGEGWKIKLIFNLVMLIIINPIIISLIMKSIPFKVKGLRNKPSIKD